ncbi:MAG: hypothetical protein PHI50_02190 [Alphaproteobacteria bacterium]|nr:hypothetical protein [Alphaproteobacteria bacterium]
MKQFLILLGFVFFLPEVLLSKPSFEETIPKKEDPLSNREDWNKEYQKIISNEKDYLSLVRYHPRSIKRLYQNLDKQERQIKKRQEDYLNSLDKNDPEFIESERERIKKEQLLILPNELGTDENMTLQEKETRLNTRIKENPNKFYKTLTKKIRFQKTENPKDLLPGISILKTYVEERKALIQKENSEKLEDEKKEDKEEAPTFSEQELSLIKQSEEKPRLGRHQIQKPNF